MAIDYWRLFRENPNPVAFAQAVARAQAAEVEAQRPPVPPGAPGAPAGPGGSSWTTITPEGARTEPDTSSPPPPPVDPAAAAAAAGRVLPYPDAQDEYERARNQEAAISWEIEDFQKALGKLDPDMAQARNIIADNIRDARTRLTAQQATVQAAKTARDTQKKPHTIQKQEKHPNGGTYLVTYDVDAQGNEKWNGQKPQELFPPSEQTGLQLETAQFNLKKAQSDFAEATSPEAKREAQLKLDLAEFNLQQAHRKAGQEDRPAVLSGVPESQEWILSRDPTTGAVTRERNPAYRAPVAQIIQPGTGRTITTRDPTTGAISTEPNPAWTPEMEEAQQLELANLRRGQLPQNPLAAYTQEAQRLQGEAQKELDRLRDLQRTGALSAADASTQFQTFIKQRVEPQLAGLRTQAEEAQRTERSVVEERNRLEQIRADTANQERERFGATVGENARTQALGMAPNIRTADFLKSAGNVVAGMSARAGAPNVAAAGALPAGPRFQAGDFDPAKYAAAMPDFDAIAKQGTARALAGLSPAAARLANMPTVTMPQGPDLTAMLGAVPFTGALTAPPPGLQPMPGMGALDQGNGMARSIYPGVNGGQGGYLDWRLPPPPFGG